jgi:SAM-dependent methyltransferase
LSGRTCPACRSEATGQAFATGGIAWRRCRRCGSLFDPDPPGADELRSLYEGREYFVKESPEGAARHWGYPDDYLAERGGAELKFDRVLAHLERYCKPGRLLDVGSGPGFLVAAAEQRGWKASGIDLNEWAVEYGRRLGIDLTVGDPTSLDVGDGELQAITMMDLIEHLPDPEAAVAEAARAIRPGGALAVLTPDAGSAVGRMLGGRWPELARPKEHTALFSVKGLSALLSRHGFAPASRHSVGKIATLATLAADVAPAAPRAAAWARDRLAGSAVGTRVIDFDPRTKFCLYARRLPPGATPPAHRPVRVPRHPERLADVESAIAEELESLAAARRFCDWMFDRFAAYVAGSVAEVGAGIGTFSARILGRDPEHLLLIEPEESCARMLADRFGADRRVALVREQLPESPALRRGQFDLVVCQNVLEHVGDDTESVAAMAEALRPGGRLALVVPAGEKLFGSLDDAYGHWRRYEPQGLRALIEASGLEIDVLEHVNALAVPAWRAKSAIPGARVGGGSIRAYDRLLAAWRPLEERLRPRSGLSLFCLARRPTVGEGAGAASEGPPPPASA